MNPVDHTNSCVPALLPAGLAASLLFVGSATGQAGGLYLPENGGPINGTAQAGSAAVARDAETAWLNPAGMTRLKSPELLFTLMPVYVDLEFNPNSLTTASGTDGGNQGGWLPAAALFLAVPLNEQVALGFSVTSLAGFAVDPDDSWVARTWMTEATLVALNLEPSVGVRISDEWSAGAGVDIQYLTFEQKLRGPLMGNEFSIDGDSWEVGFSLSTLWEPQDDTRVGLRYRSQVDHDLSGDLTVMMGRPVSTSFTLPMSVTASTYHELDEQWAILADVGWTDWSVFDRNVITFDGAGLSTELPRNFKDTWNVALGAHHRASEDWLVMFGGGYVSSAVSDANRTPDLPVDEQVRLSAGLEYQINEQWKVGGSYTFAWIGDNELDVTTPIAGRVAGDYDAFIHVIGLYGQVSF